MEKFIRFILIALIPAFFCSLLSSPISYGLPLNCPQGSRVIGIECFDGAYNNTTPWYRKDFGASAVTFPFWFALGLVLAWRVTSAKTNNSGDVSMETDWDDSSSSVTPFAPVTQSASDHEWLPTDCPHCGAAIDTKSVTWINSFEARCSFCGGVIKKP